eukprot:6795105-Prymnesium_polylepis.1
MAHHSLRIAFSEQGKEFKERSLVKANKELKVAKAADYGAQMAGHAAGATTGATVGISGLAAGAFALDAVVAGPGVVAAYSTLAATGPLGWIAAVVGTGVVVAGSAWYGNKVGRAVGELAQKNTKPILEKYGGWAAGYVFETLQVTTDKKVALASAYQVMNLDARCFEEELNKRYRQLMKEYHPDRNEVDDTEQHNKSVKAMEINAAYDLIVAERGQRPLSKYWNRVFYGTPSSKGASSSDDAAGEPEDEW